MKERVRLSILNEEVGRAEVWDAVLLRKEEAYYLFYETAEGRSRMIVTPKEARIRRGEDPSSEMVISVGQETDFVLHTPAGWLPLSVFGQEILIREDRELPFFEFTYELRQDGLPAGEQHVHVGLFAAE